jgi:hypothetical protein
MVGVMQTSAGNNQKTKEMLLTVFDKTLNTCC